MFDNNNNDKFIIIIYYFYHILLYNNNNEMAEHAGVVEGMRPSSELHLLDLQLDPTDRLQCSLQNSSWG